MEGAYEYEHTAAVKFKKCKFCEHEQDRRCSAKPGRKSIKLNKKRAKCKEFKADENRLSFTLMNKKPVPVIRRPDWFWLGKDELTKLASTLMAEHMVQSTAGEKDLDHPTTGDLSRFIIDEEKE